MWFIKASNGVLLFDYVDWFESFSLFLSISEFKQLLNKGLNVPHLTQHIILTLLDGGVKSIPLALRAFISTIPLTLSK